MTTPKGQRPPMNPTTDEADERQLELARLQGESYAQALRHMITKVADGGDFAEARDWKTNTLRALLG
jgi:hypothetical protein